MTMNYLEKINQLYAFVSVDEFGEGIVGMTMDIGGRDTFMPFVCADKKRVESIRPHAIQIAKESGKTIKLIRFTTREELEVIE